MSRRVSALRQRTGFGAFWRIASISVGEAPVVSSSFSISVGDRECHTALPDGSVRIVFRSGRRYFLRSQADQEISETELRSLSR